MKFDKPTLITITAPTCSGKTYLLEKLIELGFSRIISTTTRAPREDEVEGVDYYFITMEQSLKLEAAGVFAELIDFCGTRYGVTEAEMSEKMSNELAPIVILEPQGLKVYEKYCLDNDWDIFKIYISTPENVRLNRLVKRTVTDICGHLDFNTHLDVFNKIEKIIKTHTDRLLSITCDERLWQTLNSWNAIVSGEDVDLALFYIEQGIKWRNFQNAPGDL